MSTRSMRDKSKGQQERHQVILSTLLKDEDNKYCVDCDAKGPRWASWNLGIFLCIRCAGIHRNLGVHISKVKSVNLDTWTPEQISVMEEMGNSKARAVYEANIPDHFRRPQTDSSLEAFIRSKYEQKKYIAKEWIAPKPKTAVRSSDQSAEKKKPKSQSNSIQLNDKMKVTKKTEATKEVKKTPSVIGDLLGLDSPPVIPSDSFTDFIGSAASTVLTKENQEKPAAAEKSTPTEKKDDLGDLSLLGEGAGKSTKESIMALFANQPSQPQYPAGSYSFAPQNMHPQQPGMMAHMSQQPMMGQGTMGNAMQQIPAVNQQMPMMGQQQMPMMGQQNISLMAQQNNMGAAQPHQMSQMQQQVDSLNLNMGNSWVANQPSSSLSTNLWQ